MSIAAVVGVVDQSVAECVGEAVDVVVGGCVAECVTVVEDIADDVDASRRKSLVIVRSLANAFLKARPFGNFFCWWKILGRPVSSGVVTSFFGK